MIKAEGRLFLVFSLPFILIYVNMAKISALADETGMEPEIYGKA